MRKQVELDRCESAAQLEADLWVAQVGRDIGWAGNTHSPAYAESRLTQVGCHELGQGEEAARAVGRSMR
jgi:hypothetical protein